MNGNLALSRAIGDFEFKKSADLPPEQQIVTAFPDVTIHDIGEDDEFLVIACDGMFKFKIRGVAPANSLQVSGIASLHKPWSSSYEEESLQSKNYIPSARI